MKKPRSGPTAQIEGLRQAAAGCRNCPLWENATQTVFGEGNPRARIMFVGEQPGDVEDRQGHPFVGPAGRILDQAMDEAGVDRAKTYVTNAVKHFRITQQRGEVQSRDGLPDVIATFHPSYLLRLKGRPGEEEAYAQFVEDLRTAARYLQEKSDS